MKLKKMIGFENDYIAFGMKLKKMIEFNMLQKK